MMRRYLHQHIENLGPSPARISMKSGKIHVLCLAIVVMHPCSWGPNAGDSRTKRPWLVVVDMRACIPLLSRQHRIAASPLELLARDRGCLTACNGQRCTVRRCIAEAFGPITRLASPAVGCGLVNVKQDSQVPTCQDRTTNLKATLKLSQAPEASLIRLPRSWQTLHLIA